MEEWLELEHIVLEIEGIGGLGKTASVLEFIRRLGDFGEKQQYLSRDMFSYCQIKRAGRERGRF